MSKAALMQLYAIRAQVDALIISLEHPAYDAPICTHPAEARRDTSTGGGPRKFLCLTCNAEVEGVA